jgi:hypothetical protein
MSDCFILPVTYMQIQNSMIPTFAGVSSTIYIYIENDLGGDRTHSLKLRRLTRYPITLPDQKNSMYI